MNYLFITGLYRSGTTLLQKILQNHPNVFSADQPLPNLYIYLKSKFYFEKNITDNNILGTLFNNKYQLSEFIDFIEKYTLTEKDFEIIFNNAREFSGVNSKKIFNISEKFESGNLFNVYKQICEFLSEEYNKSDVLYKGTKEIITEEYIPYFLNNDIKVILIIRDIRDIINSVVMGKGADFIGDVRPTLFNIRNWRKSVAYYIKFKENSNFLTVKYEDLVEKPKSTLNKISKFLKLEQFDIELLNKGLNDYTGQWNGNSSFHSYDIISSKSVGKYKDNLNKNYIRYIENLCLPELKYLNYKIQVSEFEDISFLDKFTEPFKVNHKLFDKNYSKSKENINLEKNRINYLLGNIEINKELYFIFENIAEILRKQIKKCQI
ncbi:MAG: sulfotransferase [Bacteroidales bacterium]|nr:sulfotransferase [Bacteroidales bacterium]